MKVLFPLLLCLLLCGCARQDAPMHADIPAITVAATAPAGTSPGLEEVRQALESQYGGSLQAFPLTQRKVRGIRAVRDGLLVLSGYGSTTLSLLSGEELAEAASIVLEFELDPQDPSLQVHGNRLSYFDPNTGEAVILNEALKEVRRIALTETICGSPLLSSGCDTIYYITPTAIRAWDLDSGIHKTLKELSQGGQSLTGLHMGDTILQCQTGSGSDTKTLLLRTDNGQLIREQAGALTLDIQQDRYTAVFPTALQTTLLFGSIEGSPQALYPEDPNAECVFFARQQAAVTVSAGADGTLLTYYDLETGEIRAELALDSSHTPKAMTLDSDNVLSFLAYDPGFDCDVIFRWTVPEQAAASQDHTAAYITGSDPDTATLKACQAYADKLGTKYGIQIRVWEDALRVQPWDYEFEAESQPGVLYRELTLLDQRLSRFPAELLSDTISHFSSLGIGIVRQITGTAASGSLNIATGVQFLDNTDACIVIAAGQYSEQALYHELFHVMETHILNESIAFDQWEALNPEGFSYSYSHSTPQAADAYLSGDTRAFVDAYSMSYPKEDRARIWENALLANNRELFRSEIMQSKLMTLCQGIRDAYGLCKSPEVYPWEQYLEHPLAYTE